MIQSWRYGTLVLLSSNYAFTITNICTLISMESWTEEVGFQACRTLHSLELRELLGINSQGAKRQLQGNSQGAKRQLQGSEIPCLTCC